MNTPYYTTNGIAYYKICEKKSVTTVFTLDNYTSISTHEIPVTARTMEQAMLCEPCTEDEYNLAWVLALNKILPKSNPSKELDMATYANNLAANIFKVMP